MTQEISFISAGEDEKEAISFLLKFVEEKFLELGSSPQNKINLSAMTLRKPMNSIRSFGKTSMRFF